VDGHDDVEPGTPSAPDQQLLMVELLGVALYQFGVNTAPVSVRGAAPPAPLEMEVSPETVELGVVVDPLDPAWPEAGVVAPVEEPVVVEPVEPPATVPVLDVADPVPGVAVAGVVVDAGSVLVGVPLVVPVAEPVVVEEPVAVDAAAELVGVLVP